MTEVHEAPLPEGVAALLSALESEDPARRREASGLDLHFEYSRWPDLCGFERAVQAVVAAARRVTDAVEAAARRGRR